MCFRSGNKKTALLNVRRNMVQGHAPALYDLYSKYRSGVLVYYTKKAVAGNARHGE